MSEKTVAELNKKDLSDEDLLVAISEAESGNVSAGEKVKTIDSLQTDNQKEAMPDDPSQNTRGTDQAPEIYLPENYSRPTDLNIDINNPSAGQVPKRDQRIIAFNSEENESSLKQVSATDDVDVAASRIEAQLRAERMAPNPLPLIKKEHQTGSYLEGDKDNPESTLASEDEHKEIESSDYLAPRDLNGEKKVTDLSSATDEVLDMPIDHLGENSSGTDLKDKMAVSSVGVNEKISSPENPPPLEGNKTDFRAATNEANEISADLDKNMGLTQAKFDNKIANINNPQGKSISNEIFPDSERNMKKMGDFLGVNNTPNSIPTTEALINQGRVENTLKQQPPLEAAPLAQTPEILQIKEEDEDLELNKEVGGTIEKLEAELKNIEELMARIASRIKETEQQKDEDMQTIALEQKIIDGKKAEVESNYDKKLQEYNRNLTTLEEMKNLLKYRIPNLRVTNDEHPNKLVA